LGLIAEVKSFTRRTVNNIMFSDVKIDPDGGSNITVEHFANPGDDSVPLTIDKVVTVSIQRTGGEVAVGYNDPNNQQKALAGDKRIYGRNSNGVEVNQVWLKNDGSVVIDNGAGSFEMQAGGDVVINGVTITVGGDVVSAGGKSLETHTHNILSGSSSPGPTGGPN
jgi:hypothetical protein